MSLKKGVDNCLISVFIYMHAFTKKLQKEPYSYKLCNNQLLDTCVNLINSGC